MAFVKVHDKILRSSVWFESHATVKVWLGLMVMADETGHVHSSRRGLMHACAVAEDEFEEAMRVLEGPDPDSCTEDDDGRRIQRVEGGWFVLNHASYRDRETDQKVKARERSRRHRERRKASRDVTQRDATLRNVTQRDATSRERNISLEAEAEAEAEAEVKIMSPAKPATLPQPAIDLAQHLYDSIRGFKPDFRAGWKPARLERCLRAWANDIRLAHEQDRVSWDRLRAAIDWVYRGDGAWWRGKIESGAKLRKQLEKLEMQYAETASRAPALDLDDFDPVAARRAMDALTGPVR